MEKHTKEISNTSNLYEVFERLRSIFFHLQALTLIQPSGIDLLLQQNSAEQIPLDYGTRQIKIIIDPMPQSNGKLYHVKVRRLLKVLPIPFLLI